MVLVRIPSVSKLFYTLISLNLVFWLLFNGFYCNCNKLIVLGGEIDYDYGQSSPIQDSRLVFEQTKGH